jgi:hypothetical protein
MKMESTLNKVTPGSWKAARVYGNNVPDSFKVFTKTFGGVCVADCGDNEENANLCAAAPDLLEALKIMVAHAQEKYPHFENERGQKDIEQSLKAIEKAEKKD